MTPHCAALMADYNQWMNARLYEACAALDPAALAADRGAFFGSILGTLNHIAVADTLWLHRFARHEACFARLGGLAGFPVPGSLDQPLAPGLPELHRHRQALDALIVYWVSELNDAHLESNLVYSSVAGVRFARRFGDLLQHFFNHQTHHRGQVSTLLCQCGIDVGVTDLLARIPNVEP